MSTLNKIRKCQTLKGKTCGFCSWAERAEKQTCLIFNSSSYINHPPFFLLTPPGLTTTFQDLCARPSWICIKPPVLFSTSDRRGVA